MTNFEKKYCIHCEYWKPKREPCCVFPMEKGVPPCLIKADKEAERDKRRVYLVG